MQTELQTVLDFDIVCLQETNFQKDTEARQHINMFSQHFKVFTFATQQLSTSITLLFNLRHLGINYRTAFEIPGRALGVTYQIQQTRFLVIGVNAPANVCQKHAFFNELNEKVAEIRKDADIILCMREFNFVENPLLDITNMPVDDRLRGAELFEATKSF